MKKYLNSPEQVAIALKSNKVVREKGFDWSFKMVEGMVGCYDDEGNCIVINVGIPYKEGKYYVEGKQ